MYEIEPLVVPRTTDELGAYTTTYFEEYDELSRSFEAQKPVDVVPSMLIFRLFDDGRIDDAWWLIGALIDAAPDEDALGFVGADVLEGLCVRGFATEAIYRDLAARAKLDDRLRYALDFVWWRGNEPDWLRAELRALGVPYWHTAKRPGPPRREDGGPVVDRRLRRSKLMPRSSRPA